MESLGSLEGPENQENNDYDSPPYPDIVQQCYVLEMLFLGFAVFQDFKKGAAPAGEPCP